ncbi:5-dehydro-2-deoxygluconokinase [Egibacter rhizosphaerae]|uniref:5-dehydro-2-deoxygluconokinase n=1 Tax=Egibacter rhizosphaerae TaxID=1670831 RepID=UPI0013F15BD6|nr:5-dehydro-2-deoxygluconokinase [Egibacter rhizosphaerae]
MSTASPETSAAPEPDLISVGRVCVDLYAEQEGAPLEAVQSFRTYVGGSAANIAVGAARQGLDVAVLTRVGDEQLGRLVRERFTAEGIDTRWVTTDPQRLTPMVLLAVRPSDDFPRIFYYPEPADLGVRQEDVDAAPIERARAFLLGGSALIEPAMRSAMQAAVKRAREHGTPVALDLDYRPVLWGVADTAQGGQMTGTDADVVRAYESVLPSCELVVGTEEEFRSVVDADDTEAALRAVREQTSALLVIKHGAAGATAYAGAISEGEHVAGFPVEVFNSVGAGDAFMSGFLRAWLDGDAPARCIERGNAAGALVVSRHGCSPAMPTTAELDYFLPQARTLERPREDGWLAHLHKATTRPAVDDLQVLAVDHRWQLEELAEDLGAPRTSVARLKGLLAEAFTRVAADLEGTPGILLDDVYGREPLEAVTGQGYWVARAVELAGSRPVALAGGDDVTATLRRWPAEQVVKCMVYCHPDDDPALWHTQESRVLRLAEACMDLDRALMLELQTPSGRRYEGDDLPRTLERFYRIGVRPEWWKLPPVEDAEQWYASGEVVRRGDPHCHGLLVLGQSAATDQLAASFAAAAREPLCKGFAVGRSIFAGPASDWFGGRLDDEALVNAIADNYRAIARLWAQRR